MSKATKAQPRAGDVAAEWVKIEDLKPWAANPRVNDGKPVEKVANSIKRFGFASPIIARREGEIIAGHTRYKAAIQLGLRKVPVRFLDLDPAEAHLLALADNKLNEVAAWDKVLLHAELQKLTASDLDLAGFTEKDLEKWADDLLNDEDFSDQDIRENYEILVICESEVQQLEIMEKLEKEGVTCKPLIS